MAVRHGYGKIAGADALVFAYDTGDTRNSYKGEPTENLFPYPQFTNHTNNVVGAASITKKDFGDGKIGIEIIQGSTSDIISFSMHSLSSAVSGATYTWSSYVHASKTSAVVKAQVTIRVDGVRYWLTNSNTWTTSVTECSHLFEPTVADQWHRVDTQFTMPTGTLTDFQLGGWYRNNSNYTLKLANAQLEIKSHPTQFLIGTRSATQGLLDLTGNNSIDLSNVTFDSNAQMTFDGTDDFINTGYSQGDITTPTIEAVVYRSTSTGRYEAIVQNNLASDDALYVYPSGILGFWPCSPSSLTVPTGQWSHVAVSYDGTDIIYSVNGVIQVTTATCGHITDWDFLRIGAASTGDGERWVGDIAVVKIYSRALSAAEVLNNYNLYKSRFNL